MPTPSRSCWGRALADAERCSEGFSKPASYKLCRGRPGSVCATAAPGWRLKRRNRFGAQWRQIYHG